MFKVVLRNKNGGQIFKKNLTKANAIAQADVMHNDKSGVWAEVKRSKDNELVYTTKDTMTHQDWIDKTIEEAEIAQEEYDTGAYKRSEEHKGTIQLHIKSTDGDTLQVVDTLFLKEMNVIAISKATDNILWEWRNEVEKAYEIRINITNV